jgi:tetratricopeptide (TPR) repeat protein
MTRVAAAAWLAPPFCIPACPSRKKLYRIRGARHIAAMPRPFPPAGRIANPTEGTPDAMDEDIADLAAALADRYRVERQVGAGGMATVYLAHDVRHGRPVALKVLRSDLGRSLGAERFHREIRLAASLQHPHIVPLYDSGEAAGLLFYVMPYVDGQSLRQRLLREGELPVSDAVRVLRDVADALAAAHRHGIVHRDLKPENVMISGRHALVTDFGVAKAVSEATGDHAYTTVGVAVGTPTYMAPEQAMGEPGVDARADVYAFGVLAYELLTGRPPFTATTPHQLLAAHVTQAADPITRHRLAVPPALEALVMRCLEKRPADRWQNADELIPHLEAALTPSGGLTPTSVMPVTARVPRTRASRRTLAAGLAAAAVAVLGGAAAWQVMGSRGAAAAELHPSRIVVAWFENGSGDPALDDVGALVADWITDVLARENFGELVSTTEVREWMEGEPRASAARARELARQTRSGVLVTGVYYQRGGQIEYRAEVLDAARGRLLGSAGPFRGGPDDTAPIDSLHQQVAVVVGDWLLGGRRETPGSTADRTRSLPAWRAYQTGMELFVRSQSQALPHLERAAELDPQWLAPYTGIWAVHLNAGRPVVADSLVRSAVANGVRLGALERHELEYFQAVLRGDAESAYQAIKRAQPLGSRTHVYLVALGASRTGRFEEALQFVARRDTTFFSREWNGWTSVQRSALHLLGRFEEEYAGAAEITRSRGTTLGRAEAEVRALAALGRTSQVDSVLAALWDNPVSGSLSPADLARTAATEYQAHGREALAGPLFQRQLEWLLSRSPEQRTAQADYAADLASAYYDLGRYAEARALYDSLHAAAPANLTRLGMLAVTALRQGDAAAARELDARLAAWQDPYVRGGHTLWRSRLAGLAGFVPAPPSCCARRSQRASSAAAWNTTTGHRRVRCGSAPACWKR